VQEGAPRVSANTVQHEARVLWSLRRRRSDVRCVLYPNARHVEVKVLQDRDLVLTEIFQEEWLALAWARVYADRLKQQGWSEIADPPPAAKETPRQRTGI
jgi:hypothetical protein